MKDQWLRIKWLGGTSRHLERGTGDESRCKRDVKGDREETQVQEGGEI